MDVVHRVVKTTEVDGEKTGARFRKYRKDAGVVMEDLATHTKTSESLLYMLEQGKRKWTQDKLDRLVKAVDVLSGRVEPAGKPRKK
jgi:transcriptional regulator with XRE-family HTH domain